MAQQDSKAQLLGMTLAELKTLAAELGLPGYTAGQMAKWIYQKHATKVAGMTDISAKGRSAIEDRCRIGAMKPSGGMKSEDGTVKYLFPTSDGKKVEAVFIPDKERATLCVSSQVGCRMGCAFCLTGKQGHNGNLSAGDILNQVVSLPESGRITNVVFMGQGEPLDNVDNVLKAAEIMTAPYGFGWSPKRITISTVGLRTPMKRLIEECDCNIAVSMHTPFPEERARLAPAEKAFGIEEIAGLLRGYDFSHQRRLSFEYVVLGGVNDTEAHARRTAKLLHGMECRVNLIKYHPVPGAPFKAPDDKAVAAMRDYLTAHGTFATVRASRGQDISAACGMLTTKAAG